VQVAEIGSFLSYFEGIRNRTERVIAVIPPDRLEWRPREGAFSSGDLIRHVAATERYMFAENVAGRPSRYPGHGPELAEGFDDVVKYLRRMHAESVAIMSELTPETLQFPCITPAGTPITRWKWLRAMVEHEVHHRGQIYLIMNLLGVTTPPLYGLTSEQVKANSIP
jgi:uncharacterized damage-inducible protein DinB